MFIEIKLDNIRFKNIKLDNISVQNIFFLKKIIALEIDKTVASMNTTNSCSYHKIKEICLFI